MDKLKLAHDWAMKSFLTDGFKDEVERATCAWQYADAMQAEAKKREDKTRPDVLLTKDKDGNCLHFHREFGRKKCMDCGASLEEWQPDWSQAPNDAAAWEYLGHGSARWHTTTKGMYRAADLFGYSGTDMLLVERPNGF